MNNYTYFTNQKDFPLELQENLIYHYTKNSNTAISKEFKITEIYDNNKLENSINNVIYHIPEKSRLIFASLNILGNSSYKILQKIYIANQKYISIYLVQENLFISYENKELLSLIEALFSIDKNAKKQRLETAKRTHQKNRTKRGRKSGKKRKSMFDKYKKKIMKLHSIGIPKTKILAELKQKDTKFTSSSPQALGQYIKKIKTQKNNNTAMGSKQINECYINFEK